MENFVSMIDHYIDSIRSESGIFFDIQEPFDYEHYRKLRPKGMRQKKYKQELGKLICLYRLRQEATKTDEPVVKYLSEMKIQGAIHHGTAMFWMLYELERQLNRQMQKPPHNKGRLSIWYYSHTVTAKPPLK